MAKSVKLADIAAIVGVSTVTVSKALSDQKGVSEELREKIKQLADEMGYKQPSALRKEHTSTTLNIGVIIPEHFLSKYDSFYWNLYQEITKYTVSQDGFSILEVVNSTDEQEKIMPKLVQENKVDGLIVLGGMHHDYLTILQEEGGVPVIYLDFYDENQQCDAVITNNFYGAYLMTNYLCKMGHRKIAYVGTLMSTQSITDRYLGYLKSVMENGLEFRQDWIIPDRDKKTGMIDEEKLMKLPEDMPTAFVCNCDLTAGYLIKKLRAAGYRVPDDISVVGFDNFIHPGMCDVAITTYEVDVIRMVKRVVDLLSRKIRDNSYHSGTSIVEGHMMIKDSVKKYNVSR